MFNQLGRLVASGAVREAELDTALQRLFYVRMRHGEFDPPATVPYADEAVYGAAAFDADESHGLASLSAARQSMTLLHNEGGSTLPLAPGAKVALFGCLQRTKRVGLGGEIYSDCAVAATAGYDSGAGYDEDNRALPPKTTPPPDAELRALGYDAAFVNVTDPTSRAGAEQVTAAAAAADYSVLFLGRAGAEGESGSWCTDRTCGDTTDMALPPEQAALLAAALSSATPLVLVLFNCNPLDLEQSIRAPPGFGSGNSVRAVLHAFYPQLWAGRAVAGALSGAAPPAGRMPYSWPRLAGLADAGAITDYTMGGTSKTYRYSRPGKVPPLFPFGFGLSYASWRYGAATAQPAAPRTCDNITVTVQLTNTGKVASDEVVQVYASWHSSSSSSDGTASLPLTTPQAQLVGFERVHVEAGARISVALVVTPAQLALIAPSSSAGLPTWVAAPVSVTLSVGGQQPGQDTSAPSNVEHIPLDITGPTTPVDRC